VLILKTPVVISIFVYRRDAEGAEGDIFKFFVEGPHLNSGMTGLIIHLRKSDQEKIISTSLR
jgi:hypothetical protein